MAVEQNHCDIVEYLLKAGATCSVDDVDGIRTKTKKVIDSRIDELINEYTMNKLMTQNTINSTNKPINQQQTLLNELIQLVLTNDTVQLTDRLKDNKYSVLVNDIDHGVQTDDINDATPSTSHTSSNIQSQPLLLHAAQYGYNECIVILLKYKANIDYRDRNGRSALHMAIAGNLYSTTKLLLDHGANTTGIDMRQIRFWSSSNISTRIDNLLKKYPVRPLIISKQIKSSLDGLSYKEYKLQEKIFRYFDTNNDGFISEIELRSKLTQTHRGPSFDPKLIHDMIKVANSYNHAKGVSFEQFVDILSDAAEQTTNQNISIRSNTSHSNAQKQQNNNRS